MSATAPAVIIAAPASGSGKTVLTLALLRAYRRTGLSVASFKVGPDFIDPAFHSAASGRPCYNLDPWGMRSETLAAAAVAVGRDAELVIGEGVMGLFDGATVEAGSTADLAAHLRLPVVLVVDASAQAASAAAVVHGFATFRDDVTVAGVIFNRTGGEGHGRILAEACAGLDVAQLGAVPHLPELALPERHLGLVQAMEHQDLEGFLEAAARAVTVHLDLDAIRGLARPPALDAPSELRGLPVLGQRIAVARDAAFAFAYPHLLDGWRQAGAEVVPFSPLADEAPDAAADAVFLPGGYPELHAGRLASSSRFLGGLRHAAERDIAVYGECGGYMTLGERLVDARGTSHAMAGLLPLETSFAERGLHLGYRRATLAADTALGVAGARFRGHEFHYATVLREAAQAPLFACTDVHGEHAVEMGGRRGSVFGSFLHLIDAAD